MTHIVFLEVDPEDAPRMRERFPKATILSTNLAEEGTLEQCRDAEIISCFIYSKFTKENLSALPALKLLCTRSVGYNHIDLEECTKRRITVCNVPDYGSHVIAEHVFALLLGTLRHIHEGDERVEGGAFDYRGLRGMAMRSKTLGIVGTGKIGRHVAHIAHGLGMKILATDQCRTMELSDILGVQYVPFETLLKESDIVTLHVPLTKETKHMINAQAIAAMRDGVILVNTARGEIIDSGALLAALKSGKISYALLDVLEHEKDFEWNKELIAHPNVVTTPHIAFYADDAMHNMYEDCFQSIEQWRAGVPPEHIVHPLNVVCDLPGVQKRK